MGTKVNNSATMFNLNSAPKIEYVLEERTFENPTEISFTWTFATQEEAEQKLLEFVREQGVSRLYAVWGEIVL